jgi:hypothetical protein
VLCACCCASRCGCTVIIKTGIQLASAHKVAYEAHILTDLLSLDVLQCSACQTTGALEFCCCRHYLHLLQLHVVSVLSGPFMTSLDMAGVSLTLLATTPDMEPLLAADTQAPGWPRTSSTSTTHSSRQQPVPLPTGPSNEPAAATGQQAGAAGSSGQDVVVAGCVRAAAEALQQAVPLLNEMDAKVRCCCCCCLAGPLCMHGMPALLIVCCKAKLLYDDELSCDFMCCTSGLTCS